MHFIMGMIWQTHNIMIRYNFISTNDLLKHNLGFIIMKSQRGIGFFALVFLVAFIAGLVALGMYLVKLDDEILKKFEGQRWSIPAKVYARPLELKVEQPLDINDLVAELKLLNYKAGDTKISGTYQVKGSEITIHTRGFHFGESVEPSRIISITINANTITKLVDLTHKQEITTKAYLEPMLIGGIYPQHHEDRVLIKLENTPKTLINALIATEDRNFYNHHGISLRGTARAIVSNVTGGKRQGGSTLTQQLIKNFYLTSEKTYKRKAKEAMMAVLLELHYSKDEILEAYLNEVNLGQDGSVSINGYGLASQFYFGRPLNELNIAQHAFLAGLVQGPTLYNPKKNPEGALKRRNVVLKNMLTMGYITQQQYDTESKRPLGVTKASISTTRFPDFMDLVRHQLRQDYKKLTQNLDNQGFSIFTTLDPIAQIKVEKTFKAKVKAISPHLQGATIVADPHTGHIQVVVGSSEAFAGFNRALDAKRQVGSLLKPIVFLSELEEDKHWATEIKDEAIEISSGNKTWTPKNYGGREHKEVPMLTALAQSYNLATVHLANKRSPQSFGQKIRSLGVYCLILPNDKKVPNFCDDEKNKPEIREYYPSIWLGAVELTPMNILSLYQTFASGGQKRPLQSIYRVVDQKGEVIERYPLSPQQVIKPDYAYLLNYGLQQVVNVGTGQSAKSAFPNLNIAGKTGTTNDGRDAWFAGYSGNHVAVVWVGLDNNKTTGLTGSTGALPVWINVMKQFRHTPVEWKMPSNIAWHWIDKKTGLLSAENCGASLHIPMTLHTVPHETVACAQTKPTTSLDELSDETKISIDNDTDVEQQSYPTEQPSRDETDSPFGEQTSFNEQNMPY